MTGAGCPCNLNQAHINRNRPIYLLWVYSWLETRWSIPTCGVDKKAWVHHMREVRVGLQWKRTSGACQVDRGDHKKHFSLMQEKKGYLHLKNVGANWSQNRLPPPKMCDPVSGGTEMQIKRSERELSPPVEFSVSVPGHKMDFQTSLQGHTWPWRGITVEFARAVVSVWQHTLVG